MGQTGDKLKKDAEQYVEDKFRIPELSLFSTAEPQAAWLKNEAIKVQKQASILQERYTNVTEMMEKLSSQLIEAHAVMKMADLEFNKVKGLAVNDPHFLTAKLFLDTATARAKDLEKRNTLNEVAFKDVKFEKAILEKRHTRIKNFPAFRP